MARWLMRSISMTISIRPLLTDLEMKEFRICTAWLHIAKVGSIAMYDFLVKYAKEGRQVWEEYQVATQSHPVGGFGLFDLTGFPQLTELEKKYLPETFGSGVVFFDMDADVWQTFGCVSSTTTSTGTPTSSPPTAT